MYVKLRKAYGHICLLSCADQVTKAFRSLQLGPADYLEFIIQLVAESHTAFVDKIRWIRSVLSENKLNYFKNVYLSLFFQRNRKNWQFKMAKKAIFVRLCFSSLHSLAA